MWLFGPARILKTDSVGWLSVICVGRSKKDALTMAVGKNALFRGASKNTARFLSFRVVLISFRGSRNL